MKLRLVQSLPGRSFTRVDFFAPPEEFSLGRVWRKIVDENGARFLGVQKIERQLERAKIFWTIDQDGIAGLQSPRQNLARIAVEQLDVRARFQFRFRSSGVL